MRMIDKMKSNGHRILTMWRFCSPNGWSGPNKRLFCTLALVLLLLPQMCYCESTAETYKSSQPCFCHLASQIDECPCTIESVDQFCEKYIQPLLKQLLKRDFFRYYKVNMQRPCPFWEEDKYCHAGKECGIAECDDRVPIAIKDSGVPNSSQEGSAEINRKKRSKKEQSKSGPVCNDDSLDPLDDSISQEAQEAFIQWAKHDDAENKFCDVDDDRGNNMHYVDLHLNPERYTGYKGASAAKVWKSIYEENCFKPNPKFDKHFLLNPKITGLCLEKRVFYRLISGLHTSITVQVAANHYTPPAAGFGTGKWSQNTEMFKWRFSEETTNGEGPQRLKNLYFALMLELRAIAKVAPYLRRELFYTGNEEEDEATRHLVDELIRQVESFPDHFDERQMFQGTPALAMELREEFRQHFLNTSRIMDCVACDKCRLWGKVNTHGMGTALKILFSDIPSRVSPKQGAPPPFQLLRDDIVALFNSFGRYASSIEEVGRFRKLIQPNQT